MKNVFTKLATGAIVALLVSGCQPVSPQMETDAASQGSRAPAASLTVDASQAITLEETITMEPIYSDPMVKAAMSDLSQQLSVPTSEITVVSYDAVTWPDSGLGCPKPDMAYAQVLVDGARIRLQVGDTVYEYHSGGGQPPFLCENPTDPSPGSVVPVYGG
jgi:hypothetical protein